MFRRLRISLALACLFSMLCIGAAHPAPTAAAGITPTATCTIGGSQKSLESFTNALFAFAEGDQAELSRTGAKDCHMSFGQKATYIVASNTDLGLPGEGLARSSRAHTYLVTTDPLRFNAPPGDYSKFFISLFAVGDVAALSAPAAPQPNSTYFPETGHNVPSPFREYWAGNGGLAIYGYPITEPFEQAIGGVLYTVQYFERARFEYHPENGGTIYEVLLGQFGREIAEGRRVDTTPIPPGKDQTCAPFKETGHHVCDRFLAYWQANGGLAQFGFPLSDQIQEILENGQTYTVQYFERARFEYHPENAPPYDILLGQFGRSILSNLLRLQQISAVP